MGEEQLYSRLGRAVIGQPVRGDAASVQPWKRGCGHSADRFPGFFASYQM